MDTVQQFARRASKVLFGGDEAKSGEEPLSGHMGNVAAGEPYDAGNIGEPDKPAAPSTAMESQAGPTAANMGTQTTGSRSTTTTTATTATTIQETIGKAAMAAAAAMGITSAESTIPESEATTKPGITEDQSPPIEERHAIPRKVVSPMTTTSATSPTTTRSPMATTTTTSSPMTTKTSDTTTTSTSSMPIKAPANTPKSTPSQTTPSRTSTSTSPTKPTQAQPKSMLDDEADEDNIPEVKLTGPGPRPLEELAREHGGDAGDLNTPEQHTTRGDLSAAATGAGAGAGAGKNRRDSGKSLGGEAGTGEEYVKSSGLAADGGDFDAAKPGAGREADRLLEAKGVHRFVQHQHDTHDGGEVHEGHEHREHHEHHEAHEVHDALAREKVKLKDKIKAALHKGTPSST
ncbi:hypothetical protein C8A05DRAFT_45385 [Staphylotrichum tortipilum]|uniref:Uncharacterized protein n=1 Tax=Staphylotrichum tortipilum TaxID=2831512 RepID=A0AAN6MIQ2_9PEZI|nr:hypothetical protein C8A05DRAFT_45385 [Staphylotrichum longicolle]